MLAGALVLSAGVALAEDTSGKTSTDTAGQSGTVGLSAAEAIDRDNDGKISLVELDESIHKLDAAQQEAALAGLTKEQVQELKDECQKDRIPPDQYKDICERIGRLNI
jgi:hypothetical protein